MPAFRDDQAKERADIDSVLDQLPPASERQGVPGHDKAVDLANGARLLSMRAAKMTYEQIAQALGYADASGARFALLRALDRHTLEKANELRTIENISMDADERVLAAAIQDTALDWSLRLRAVDTRTRLRARRARMNGLDAPVQVAISGGVKADLDDALADLRTVMGEVVTITDTPEAAQA